MYPSKCLTIKIKQMKNYIIRYILLAVVTTLTWSCSDDFITLESISEATAEGFYRTGDDFNNAVVACYDALQSNNQYGLAFDRLLGLRADDAVDDNASASSRASDIDKFVASASNTFIESAWKGTYIGISRCNIVISRIDAIDMDASLKKQLKAEAQFVRALIYFNAVRIWGDVPLITAEQSVQQTNQQIQDKTLIRNSVADVYAAIIQDLMFAELNLPASNGVRATSGAAKSLLGKVYLTQGKYPEAAAKLNEVIGDYQLLPNFADVFDVGNKNNAEIVFAVSYDKGVDGEGHAPWFSNANFVIVPNSLLSAYNPNDSRLPLVQTSPGTTGLIPGKFFDLEFQGQVGNDFPVLRYSDVLLMRAEALNEVAYDSDVNGDAFTLLNQVRTRATLTPYTNTDLTNQQEFREAILLERKFELALEFDRWFDLVRTGTAISEMAKVGQTISAKDLLFPIPQSEMEIVNNPSGFPQNPGY